MKPKGARALLISHYPALMLSVRFATADDLDALLTLWRELEQAQGRFRYFPPVPEAAERITRSFTEAIASPDADVLLALDDGEPVGMTLVHLEPPSRMSDETAAELSRVVVRTDRRRSGIGEALVAAAERWAQVRGIRTLLAAIFVANEPSMRFWHALGFDPWVERSVRPVPPAES